MTQEQKAKAYDEALKVLHKYDGANIMFTQDLKEEMFPELKESEDERIINNIKKVIGWYRGMFTEKSLMPEQYQEINAWLEEQGQHKKFRDSIQVGDKVTRNKDGVLVNLSQLQRVAKPAENTDKQEEQSPANKVEPKFKKGDWCIDNEDGTIFQIVKVLDNTYTYKTNDGKEYSCTHYSLENDAKLWTIQDAKLCDVLACPNDAGDRDVVFIFKNINSDEGWVFCFCASDANGCFCTNNDYVGNYNSTNISPATKEQRDLLFQKMKEAGYEWDAEKKELKKIEQKSATMSLDEAIEHCKEKSCGNSTCALEHKQLEKWLIELKELKEQKSAWSEEDEKMCNDIIQFIEKGWTDNGKSHLIPWLKSLKDRVQPQSKQEWSEEDESLRRRCIGAIDIANLSDYTKDSLLNWLKSLRPQNRWAGVTKEQIDTIAQHLENIGNSAMAEILYKIHSQSEWKPSDEQMIAIQEAMNIVGILTLTGSKINSLYQDLKKLKEG